MKVLLTQLTLQELEDAIRCYEMEYHRLGKKFKEEAKKAAFQILEYPKAWPEEKKRFENICSINSPINFCTLLN